MSPQSRVRGVEAAEDAVDRVGIPPARADEISQRTGAAGTLSSRKVTERERVEPAAVAAAPGSVLHVVGAVPEAKVRSRRVDVRVHAQRYIATVQHHHSAVEWGTGDRTIGESLRADGALPLKCFPDTKTSCGRSSTFG